MISEENLAQLRAMMKALMEEILEERGLRKLPSKAALRQRAYRERVTQSLTKRNGSHRGNGNGSVTDHNKSVTRKSKREEPFVMPEWLKPHEDLWDEWVRARTKIKKPPTEFAKRLASLRLERLVADGGNVRQLLADAALHNWQDFYQRN